MHPVSVGLRHKQLMTKLVQLPFLMIVFAVVAVGQMSAPKAISSPDPVYPPEAAEMGLGGTVIVFVEVDKKGEVSVKNAFGPVAPCSNLNDKRTAKIRNAVIAAAKSARFDPVLKDGKPVSIELSLTFQFDKAGKPARRRGEGLEGPGKVVEAGVLQGRVKHLAKPDYPVSARAMLLSGTVPVSVLTDTDGKIIAAAPIGGPEQLRHSASVAACKSAIEPVILSGVPVEVTGVINYTFMR